MILFAIVASKVRVDMHGHDNIGTARSAGISTTVAPSHSLFNRRHPWGRDDSKSPRILPSFAREVLPARSMGQVVIWSPRKVLASSWSTTEICSCCTH